MVDIPKRFTQKSGPNLPSWEQIHIYKDPPKSIMTRKKERVSEADVMWMTRPDGPSSDPTRINESISYFAKGVNPSVEVNYSNLNGGGSKTNVLPYQQSGALYKLDVVRPPISPPETYLPLSRPRIHQNKVVETNPGLPPGYNGNYIADDVDKVEIYNKIKETPTGPATVQATAYYKIEAPNVMSAKYAINEDDTNVYDVMTNPSLPTANIEDFVCREQTPYGIIVRPTYSVTSAPSNLGHDEVRNDDASSKVKKEVLLSNIRPNFQLIIYDPSTHSSNEVQASIQDRNHIAVQASLGLPITINNGENGVPIKLKDYNWTAVNTNVGMDNLIITIQDPEIQLDRNTPLYAVQSSMQAPVNINDLENPDYNFDSKINDNGYTNVGLNMNINQLEHKNYELEGKVGYTASSNPANSSVYNADNVRKFQEMKNNKQVYHSSFDNQGSYIPSVIQDRQRPQFRTKDNTQNQYAARQVYERLFE